MPFSKLRLAALAAGLALLPGCSGTVDIDAITFRAVPQEAVDSARLRPGVWINTNINQPGLFGGKVRSASPYAIHFSSTDESHTFEELHITALEITYADGQVEPAAAALAFPLEYNFRPHEAVNSNGTAVVRTQLNVLSAEVEGVITRDEDFRVEVSGRFTRKGDDPIPFELDQRFTKVHDKRTVSTLEAFKDV